MEKGEINPRIVSEQLAARRTDRGGNPATLKRSSVQQTKNFLASHVHLQTSSSCIAGFGHLQKKN